MRRKRTPTKPKKARKVAAAPQRWPCEYEDIDHLWARDAIIHGNAAILARYLREVDEIDPRVRRKLAKVLNPTSNDEFWRLHARYSFRGTPTKQATVWKNTFDSVLVPLAKLLSGTKPIDARCHRTLAKMLDSEPHHPLRLYFKQRKSGRPPLEFPLNDRPVHVPAPIEDDPAMLLARRAERIRRASKTGTKVPLKQLHEGSTLSTLNRRLQRLRKAKR
jgi:hypothetical protein